MILTEAKEVDGFMKLLMKQRNTGDKWTLDEKAKLKSHLHHMAVYIPILFVFLLPFGTLLIPVLAEILDRRKQKREHINP